MILFRADMARAILEGRKTVTRRRGRRRWKVGAIRFVYTRLPFAKPPGEPFARVRIVSVDAEASPMCSVPAIYLHEEVRREGFDSFRSFGAAYREINGYAALDEPCWRVEFELVTEEVNE